MIKISVDVTKLDKNKFFVGKKGTYADLLVIATPNSKYDHDYMVKQDTKEGENLSDQPVVGNGRNLGGGKKINTSAPASQPDADEIPF